MLENILLGIVTMCTMISYLPQTVKLIKTKKSNDLSLKSWILWVVSSLSYTLYALLCSDEVMLLVETSVEFFFCLLILSLAVKYSKNKLISTISCGILEYFSGLGMYIIGNGKRCWDYNSEILNFGNIGGFVCLRSVLFFGLSSLLLIYAIIPLCFYLAKKMNKKVFLTISILLCSIILFDEFYNLIFARVLHLPRAYDVYSKLGFKYVKFK